MSLSLKSWQQAVQSDFGTQKLQGKVMLADTENDPKPDMFDILEDVNCPICLGELSVGDYVCWGMCLDCAEDDFENFYLESEK